MVAHRLFRRAAAVLVLSAVAAAEPRVVAFRHADGWALKDGQTVGGTLRIHAVVEADAIERVEFFIDGRLVGTERTPPYYLGGDRRGEPAGFGTAKLGPGVHILKAVAYDAAGASGAKEIRLRVHGREPIRPVPPSRTIDAVRIGGTPKRWHKVEIRFPGPAASETSDPNPFLAYRLDVTFRSRDATYRVPGFYAGDGRGGASGNVWAVRFAPDRTGRWTYRASFRRGRDVAISLDPGTGEPLPPDGASGAFEVAESDASAGDLRREGRLAYVGEHYLRFLGSGRFFIKGGADSPENFLAYAGFEGTPPTHRYAPHLRDWRPGDPDWGDGRGRAIIGALNYLASKGMNSVYFLTMNVAGDGDDVWPWLGRDERLRFDVGKLAQWEIVFTHMDRRGIQLHVVTQETENDQLLDGGALGRERKLYYRELVARFAHHLAVTWNLGEENTNTDAQRKAFAAYLRALDPYDHPIVVHTFPGKHDAVYRPLLGSPHLEGASLQMGDMRRTHAETAKWVTRSAAAGRKWIVCLDEIGPAHTGVKPDADDPAHDRVRRDALWGNLMAGGAGCEWYFGYKYAHNDLRCEDWRSRDRMWDLTRHAIAFFQEHLRFPAMRRADDLVSDPKGYGFARPGEIYAVYLPGGGTAELDLGAARGSFSVRWYDPRHGGPLQAGSVARIRGPGRRGLGRPPSDPAGDWAVLVRREGAK